MLDGFDQSRAVQVLVAALTRGFRGKEARVAGSGVEGASTPAGRVLGTQRIAGTEVSGFQSLTDVPSQGSRFPQTTLITCPHCHLDSRPRYACATSRPFRSEAEACCTALPYPAPLRKLVRE